MQQSPSHAGARGLPPADPRVERVARIVGALAVAWFALASCWCIAGPFGAGHVAATAARGIMAENMLLWHIWAPVRSYTFDTPSAALYYAHHPWGIFWVTTLMMEIFGRHDFVCRLAPALESIGTAMLCYGVGRALWGPVAGALATCMYVVLPITLSFANFNGFEVPLVFGAMLTTWGYVRFGQTWRRRWMAVSLIGLAFFVNTDWEALVFVGVVLGTLLLTGLILPRRWFGSVDARRFGQWWALAASISVGTVILYLAMFHHYGALPDLFAQGQRRASGNSVGLSVVLEARAYWIELMFTPPAILIGKIGVVLIALRLVVLRRVVEIFPLALFSAALFEYVFFKEGADVHIYWPLPFAPLAGLGLGVLAATIQGSVTWLFVRIRKAPPGSWLAYVTLGCLAVVPLAMVRDAVTIFAYGRDTGDRFDEGGRVVYQDLDKHAALAWMHDRLEGQTRVDLHYNMAYDWSQEWTLDRVLRMTSSIPTSAPPLPSRYFVTDARMLSAKDQETLAHSFHVQALGPFWFVDYEDAKAPLTAYALVPRKPGFFAWYLRYGNDPIYDVVASPPRTWELRTHLGQEPGSAPASQPKTLDETRILHNVAVARGDQAAADRWSRQLEAQLDRAPATDFSDGTRLLGVSFKKDDRRLYVFFRAGRAASASAAFDVHSYVEQPMRWSLVPADEKARVVGARFEIDPTLWKKDFIYAAELEVRPRPGLERYYGAWRGHGAPRATGGDPRVLLLTTR